MAGAAAGARTARAASNGPIPSRATRTAAVDTGSPSLIERFQAVTDCFLSVPVLEELNCPLVFLRGDSGFERAEVRRLPLLASDLSRAQAILARFQRTNHGYLS